MSRLNDRACSAALAPVGSDVNAADKSAKMARYWRRLRIDTRSELLEARSAKIGGKSWVGQPPMWTEPPVRSSLYCLLFLTADQNRCRRRAGSGKFATRL